MTEPTDDDRGDEGNQRARGEGKTGKTEGTNKKEGPNKYFRVWEDPGEEFDRASPMIHSPLSSSSSSLNNDEEWIDVVPDAGRSPVPPEKKHVCFAPGKEILDVNDLPKHVPVLTGNGSCPLNNMDDVFESLGGFGLFQFIILVLILGFEIPTAFLVFIPVFIGATPTIWFCDNETVHRLDACSCEGILYPVDPTVSIVAEWNLICTTSWVSDTVVSVQMFGMMFGTIFVSQFSDWYGRRFAYLAVTVQMGLASLVSAFAPNPYVYAAARFICGGAFAAFLTTTAIYAMEFLTPKWRQLSSVGPFGEGTMLLGLIAYYIRPWRTLVWVAALPFSLVILVFPFVPESPRWLLRNQNIDGCHRVLNYIARVNGKEPIDRETLEYIAEKEKPAGQVDGKVERYSYFEFCRNKTLRVTTMYLQAIWFLWAIVYFGISYNIKNLKSGNPYLNVVYMGLVDAIGYPVSFMVNSKIGRRKALLLFMSIAAFFLVSIAILQLVEGEELNLSLRALLCFLAKFGCAGARSALRTLTGESFPTVVRSMGIGLVTTWASIGAAVSPQLAFIGAYWPSVPFLSFAGMSVGGALISFLLAETSGKPLQETQKGKGDPEVQDEDEAIQIVEITADMANPPDMTNGSIMNGNNGMSMAEEKPIRKKDEQRKKKNKEVKKRKGNRVRPSAKYGMRTPHAFDEDFEE